MATAASVVNIFQSDDFAGQLLRASDILNQGGLVILPTETVYGAAALLTHPAALARLRALEPPAQPKPLIIHLDRAKAAAIKGSAEFLAPLTATVPDSGTPPSITNMSIRGPFERR